MAVILLLGSVWAAEVLEIHAVFGAFLAGLVAPKNHVLESALRERVKWVTHVLLLPLFFVYNGPRTSVGLINGMDLWWICGISIAVAVASEFLVTAACIRAGGRSPALPGSAHRRVPHSGECKMDGRCDF